MAASASTPYRAHRGWGCPPDVGTTVCAPGHSARNRNNLAETAGMSTASKSTASAGLPPTDWTALRSPIALSAPAPAHNAANGPLPGGSSPTQANPGAQPGPTSITGAATALSTAAARSTKRLPSSSRSALSEPIRRLAPPVNSRPATFTGRVSLCPLDEVPELCVQGTMVLCPAPSFPVETSGRLGHAHRPHRWRKARQRRQQRRQVSER
jgi:Tfp pilus assembly protein FimV